MDTPEKKPIEFSFKQLYALTPKNIARTADAVLGACVLVATTFAVSDHKTLAVVILIISALAKFASNFFGYKPPVEDPEDAQL